MADILIKGMEMPSNPDGTMLCVFPDGKVKCMDMETYEMTTKRAVPVPPHGRLIDADALIKELTLDDEDDNSGASLLMAIFLEVLKAAPTIIPAEPVEEIKNE